MRICSRRIAASFVEVEVLEQVADRLRTHAAAEVDAEAVRRAEAVLELAEDLLVVDDHLRLELAEELPRLLEAADRVDRGLARVLAARLDVEVHLADLERPLDDRVEVFLLDAAVGAQAEVVRELADVLRPPPTCRRRRLSSPLPSSRALSRFLTSTPETSVDVVLVRSRRPSSSESTTRWMCFVIAPFFAPVAFARLLLERLDRREDLLGRDGDLLELARREPAVVADRGVADELADLLRVLGRDLRDELDEQPADELARVLERRQRLLLGPVVQAADPEVVVLVEVPLLALREEVAAAREAVLERGERLVAVDVDAARPRP